MGVPSMMPTLTAATESVSATAFLPMNPVSRPHSTASASAT